MNFLSGHHRADCVGHWGRLWHWKAHVPQVSIIIIISIISIILIHDHDDHRHLE